MPQFSIIIITRNGAISFKKEAIVSVLMQDFEDYEVVVYNNASEKSATKYVRELQFFLKKYDITNFLARFQMSSYSNGA